MEKKTINEWKNLFAQALQRYPDFSDQDKRLDYIKQELEDIVIAYKVEKGIIQVVEPKSKEGHRYVDTNERIAGLLLNVFVLMYLRNVDIDAELHKALNWFSDQI